MSEENASKLRLKPKLVAEPEAAPRLPVVSPVPPDVSLPVATDAAKVVRLKPKLAAAPAAPDEVRAPNLASSGAADFPPAPPTSPPAIASDSPPEAEKSAGRFSLRPKASVETPSPVFPPVPPPVVTESAPPPFAEPIPAPIFVDPEQTVMPVPVAGPRTLTARPFPPPPANFPPPPTGGSRPAPPWAHSGVRVSTPKKNLGLIAGGIVAVLLLLGGGFFAYKKFMAAPAPEPVLPSKVAAKPAATAPAVQVLVEQAKQQAAAPINEVLAPTPAAVTKPAQAKIAEAPPPEPAPVLAPVELPPPPPSAAFKAWVDNLRVGGIRPGATPRVFIGGNSYLVGEVVNSQLGITFDGYNADTRKLTFRDKTGAKVDRRN